MRSLCLDVDLSGVGDGNKDRGATEMCHVLLHIIEEGVIRRRAVRSKVNDLG